MALTIKSTNSTDELIIDATSKAARVTLYDAAGNVYLPASETGVLNRPYTYSLTQNIINQASPAGSTSYTSSTVRMMIDGYSNCKFIIKSSGTGTVALQMSIYGSYDGITWMNEPETEFYLRSPQNGVMKEGTSEVQTCMPYLKIVATTESAQPTTSIVVDVIRTVEKNPGKLINFDGVIDPDKAEYRGFYQSNINFDGVATANYVYFALFNPANSPTNVSIESMRLCSIYVGNATVLTTNLRYELLRITSMTGGTALTANRINNEYPTAISNISSANPTIVVDTILQNFPITGNVAYHIENDLNPGNENYEIVLKPGEGIAVRTPVALSTNHIGTINITFGCEI